jgi:hypothetical protein
VSADPERVVELRFAVLRPTPGTYLFEEVVPKGQAPKIGKLYVKKSTLEELGVLDNPQHLHVWIAAEE